MPSTATNAPKRLLSSLIRTASGNCSILSSLTTHGPVEARARQSQPRESLRPGERGALEGDLGVEQLRRGSHSLPIPVSSDAPVLSCTDEPSLRHPQPRRRGSQLERSLRDLDPEAPVEFLEQFLRRLGPRPG